MSGSGIFYPNSCTGIKRYIGKFNEMHSHMENNKDIPENIRAIIVPHGGYAYSGLTAIAPYQTIKRGFYKRVVVIGPSHHIDFDGVSISRFESYETPCGDVQIDGEYIKELENKFPLIFSPEVHKKEHSTEVQIPLINEYFHRSKIVELIYGDDSADELEKIISYLIEDEETLTVVSTNMHYSENEDEVKMLDSECIKAIEDLNPQVIIDFECDISGESGVIALLRVSSNKKLQSKITGYQISSLPFQDGSIFEGYLSAVIGSDHLPPHLLWSEEPCLCTICQTSLKN
jgi:AmmeMemoRadiSam system protein B